MVSGYNQLHISIGGLRHEHGVRVRPLSAQCEEDPDDLVEPEAIWMKDDERRPRRDSTDALVDVFGADDAHSECMQGLDDGVSNGGTRSHDQGLGQVTDNGNHESSESEFRCPPHSPSRNWSVKPGVPHAGRSRNPVDLVVVRHCAEL